MAKYEDGCYGSLKGIALIGKVLAGRCQMRYTRVAVGKGTISEDLTPKTLMEPPDYVMDANICSIENPVDGECQVSVQINSTYVKEGYYARWLILYAEDPDEGEIPFTALCLENEPEWIRPASSIVGKLATFDIIAAVGDVDTVTATIDPDSLVTRGEWEKLAAQIALIRKSLTIPAAGWEKVGEGNYPYRLELAVEGVTRERIPALTIPEAGESTAGACGLAPWVETLDGAIRLATVSVPAEPIPAILTLQGDAAGIVVGPSGVVDRLALGAGLRYDQSGSLALDAARPADVAALFHGSEADGGQE